MKVSDSRALSLFLVAAIGLGGCGSGGGTAVEVGDPVKVVNTDEQKGPAKPTQSFDYEAVQLSGVVFDMDGLNLPELPGNGTTVKRTIAEQRKRVAKAKKAAAAGETKELALLLWYTLPKGDGKEARKQLKAQRNEAAKLLGQIATQAGNDEEILWAAAAAQHAVGDQEWAANAWDALAANFPDSKNNLRYKALRNYLDLKARQPLTHALPESLDGAPYEVAYVAAWVRFRGGDGKGAVAALAQAAKDWSNLETLPALRRDVMLIYARSGVPAAETAALLTELAKKDGGNVEQVLAALTEAYSYAGEFESAAEVLEMLLPTAAPLRKVEIHATQAQLYMRVMKPEKTAEHAGKAWTELQAAGAQGDALKPQLANAIGTYALICHTEYVKTRDSRFAQPAKAMYEIYVQAAPPGPELDKVKNEHLPNLQATIVSYESSQAAGTYDESIIKRHFSFYAEQVGACYERSLQGDPSLGAEVSVTFIIETDGKVREAKSTPAGDSGAGAVARCIEKRVMAWMFPGTGQVTQVTLPLKLAPQAAAAAAVPPAAKPAAAPAAKPAAKNP